MEEYEAGLKLYEETVKKINHNPKIINTREIGENWNQIREYFENGILKNCHQAYSGLGNLYYNGFGVTKDISKAKELYTKSCDGYIGAYSLIGALYQIQEKDVKKAIEIYQQGMSKGSATCIYNLGTLYMNGNGVTKDVSKAIGLYEQAGNMGESKALFNLGTMYMTGQGLDKNPEKAIEMFLKAGESGHGGSFVNLGGMYLNGVDVKKDTKKAAEYFVQGGKLDHFGAFYALGVMYRQGIEFKVNLPKAIEYFERTLMLSRDIRAMVSLGEIYGTDGDLKNVTKSLEYYNQASNCGHLPATVHIGETYFFGSGVKQDLAKARVYFAIAFQRGDEESAIYILKIDEQLSKFKS